MSKYSEKQSVMSQIVEISHLLDLVDGHPLMSIGLKEKLEFLKEKLLSFKDDVLEPKLSLLFSGTAVVGSRGIKSSFVSGIIKPIQEMIKTQTAEIKFLKVGRRGKSKGANESEMFLTALPVGSFGIELKQLNPTELFSELDVSNAIMTVCNIIKDTTDSDIGFAKVVDKAPTRTLRNLKIFLKEVSEENSIIKIHVNSEEIFVDEEHVKLGYLRVKEAAESEELLEIVGVLRGLLLEASKFEFVDEIGNIFTGKISDELDSDMLAEVFKEFLNVRCKIQVSKITVVVKGANPKITYTLLSVAQI